MKTLEGKEIVVLRKDSDSENASRGQAEELVSKAGLRMMTSDEFLRLPESDWKELKSELSGWWPYFWLGGGLLARGGDGDFYGRRVVGAFYVPVARYGVVGVRDQPHKHRFKARRPACECGEEAQA